MADMYYPTGNTHDIHIDNKVYSAYQLSKQYSANKLPDTPYVLSYIGKPEKALVRRVPVKDYGLTKEDVIGSPLLGYLSGKHLYSMKTGLPFNMLSLSKDGIMDEEGNFVIHTPVIQEAHIVDSGQMYSCPSLTGEVSENTYIIKTLQKNGISTYKKDIYITDLRPDSFEKIEDGCLEGLTPAEVDLWMADNLLCDSTIADPISSMNFDDGGIRYQLKYASDTCIPDGLKVFIFRVPLQAPKKAETDKKMFLIKKRQETPVVEHDPKLVFDASRVRGGPVYVQNALTALADIANRLTKADCPEPKISGSLYMKNHGRELFLSACDDNSLSVQTRYLGEYNDCVVPSEKVLESLMTIVESLYCKNNDLMGLPDIIHSQLNGDNTFKM